MIYFLADSHFGHENIIRHCNRPFANAQEMDETIINNINSIIGQDDTLYCLGDFSFRGRDSVANYRRRINCRTIHLIIGNHDRYRECQPHFTSVLDYYKLRHYYDQNTNKEYDMVMCHYPFAVWDKKHFGSFCLHGHSHGNFPPGLPEETSNGLCLDVGVDVHGFKPISIDEVIKIMDKKRELARENANELSLGFVRPRHE